MKILKPITIVCFFLALCINAQDIKNQSEIIRSSVSKGDYMILGDYNEIRVSETVKIKDIQYNLDQPNEHFVMFIDKYPNKKGRTEEYLGAKYFPDNIAFPVTYYYSYYQGNKKLQEKVGYVPAERGGIGEDRIAFVGDYLFMITDWKSKDNYQIQWVLKLYEKSQEKGKSKGKKKKEGFFKSMKSTFKKARIAKSQAVSLEKMKNEVLQPYLDAATKKQKTYYAKWIKNPKNAKTKKYIDDKRNMMKNAIKKYNDDIFNSPEYQRMLAYQKWIDNNINVTVYNKSGRKVWIGSSKKAFITHEISPGDSFTATCTSDLYYYYSDAKGAQGYKFYTGDSACGSSVTIN